MIWKPMATAPRDGTRVLLRAANGRLADAVFVQHAGARGSWTWPYKSFPPVEWMACFYDVTSDEEPRQSSSTYRMTLGERVAHVGGRATPEHTVEFGSFLAVGLLLQHLKRDLLFEINETLFKPTSVLPVADGVTTANLTNVDLQLRLEKRNQLLEKGV